VAYGIGISWPIDDPMALELVRHQNTVMDVSRIYSEFMTLLGVFA
jgi:hypothetical protein